MARGIGEGEEARAYHGEMKRALSLLVALLAGCRGGTAPSEVATGPATGTSATGTASPSAAAPASAHAPAPVDAPGLAGHGPAPLFWYREDGDTLAFWSPDVVVLTRLGDGGAPRRCRNTLPGDVRGNMYSGREVEAAFRDPEVQKIFAGPHGTPYSAESAGTLGAGYGGDPITWLTACDKCLADTGGLLRLHEVLRVVMRNQRLLCP